MEVCFYLWSLSMTAIAEVSEVILPYTNRWGRKANSKVEMVGKVNEAFRTVKALLKDRGMAQW